MNVKLILWFFAILIIVVFTVRFLEKKIPKKVGNRIEDRVLAYREELAKQNTVYSTILIHLCGYPHLQPSDITTFHIRGKNNTIYFEDINLMLKKRKKLPDLSKNEIPISNITRYEVKNEEEFRKDVTLTKLVAQGIFDVGVKKENDKNTQYLILSYTDENGVEELCAFKQVKDSQKLEKIISEINRIKYRSDNKQT